MTREFIRCHKMGAQNQLRYRALHAIHKAALQKVLSSRLIPTQLTYNNATLSSVLYVVICWLGFPKVNRKIGNIWKGRNAQCGNYRIFLSLRFYVKSKLVNLETQNLIF